MPAEAGDTQPATALARTDDLSPGTGGEPLLPTVARDSYAVAGKFAQGGIGRILKAHDPILDRTVALKELLVAGHKLDEERFIREVLLTARLQHPGIVPVYAAGRWPSGEPFYAMKLVSGRSFDRVIADAATPSARLALLPHVLAIAETLAYAHAQGIIHRDLKPGNVLVGEFGETVVIDWGLAKQLGSPEPNHPAPATASATAETMAAASSVALADPLADTPRTDLSLRPASEPDDIPATNLSARPGSNVHATAPLTRVGAVVGTPGYMSPEQADGAETDARTDVFALGAILYHTLTGRLPYEADNVAAILFKTVYESPVPLHRHDPQVPEELAAIVEKAMARAPDARYATAKAFADDLRRFQTGQIVGAHHYSAWELLLRLVRRYRTPLIVAALAVLVIVVVVVVGFLSVRKQRDRAIEAEVEALTRLDSVSFEYARQRADDDPAAAIHLLAGLSADANWRRIRQVAAGVAARGLPHILHGHTAAVSRAVFSPDDTRLATTSDDCTLRIWDLSRRTSRAYYGHTDEVWRAAWSPDLRRVATSSRDRTVRVWDLETGEAQVLVGHTAGVRNLAFTADGTGLYSSDDREFMRRWDLASGTSEVVDHCGSNNFPWTESIIGCLTPHAVILHDLRTGARTVLPATGQRLTYNANVSPDERWIAASTTSAGRVWLWDRTTATARTLSWPASTGTAHHAIREMRFSPDSRSLAVPLANIYVGVFDLESGTPELYRPHAGYTRRTAFSPDATLLASVGGDNNVRVTDRTSASERGLVGTRAFLIDAQFSRDGHALASVGNDPRVFLWPESSFRQRTWRIGDGIAAAIASEAADHDLVAIASDNNLALVDETTLQPRFRVTAPRPISALGLRPDASTLVTLDLGGGVHVWDPRSGAHLRSATTLPPGLLCQVLPTPAPHPLLLLCDDRDAYSLDPETTTTTRVRAQIHIGASTRIAGRDVAVLGGEDGHLLVLDLATGTFDELHRYPEWIQWISPIPGSDRVVVTSARNVHIWDLARRTFHALPEHTLQVDNADVSADGRRVVTSSRDNLLRVFDARSGALLHLIAPGQIVGKCIRLSPDGTTLAADQQDGTIQLWDLESSRPGESRRLTGATRALQNLRYAADGTSLIGASGDGRVLVWPDDLPRDPAGVRAWVHDHHDPDAADALVTPGCAVPPPG